MSTTKKQTEAVNHLPPRRTFSIAQVGQSKTVSDPDAFFGTAHISRMARMQFTTLTPTSTLPYIRTLSYHITSRQEHIDFPIFCTALGGMPRLDALCLNVPEDFSLRGFRTLSLPLHRLDITGPGSVGTSGVVPNHLPYLYIYVKQAGACPGVGGKLAYMMKSDYAVN